MRMTEQDANCKKALQREHKTFRRAISIKKPMPMSAILAQRASDFHVRLPTLMGYRNRILALRMLMRQTPSHGTPLQA